MHSRDPFSRIFVVTFSLCVGRVVPADILDVAHTRASELKLNGSLCRVLPGFTGLALDERTASLNGLATIESFVVRILTKEGF